MVLEYWMIATFLIVATYFMIRFYKEGYSKGSVDAMAVDIDIVLSTLKNQKIIDIVEDEDGETKIVPGDFDAFIEASKKRKS